MPVCHRCSRSAASGEMRRTPLGFVCKDGPTCKRRVERAAAEARAQAPRPGEVENARRAFTQLERLRQSLRGAWEAPSSARLRAAREQLCFWLEEFDRGGGR